MSRIADRSTYDTATRLRLLEGDMDQLEQKVTDGFAALEKRFDNIRNLILVTLASIATSAIFFALNLAVK